MSNDEKLCDRPDCPACQLERALKAMKDDGIEPEHLIRGCITLIAGLYEDTHDFVGMKVMAAGPSPSGTVH